MKVVPFCGGLGTRIREYGENLPKPMIPVGEQPILSHVMQYHRGFGDGFPQRAMEIVIASMALISFSPIIVIVAALIRFVIGSPVIFTRERIDFDCKVVTWLTFRANAAVSNPGDVL